MKLSLQHSIDQLYLVFGKYRLKPDIRSRSCPCCVDSDEIKMLLFRPLKQLNADELGHFMRSATTTYGDLNDYKHFLPRILELMSVELDLIDDFMTFEKLEYNNWESWDTKETEAIKNFMNALWQNKINDFDITVEDLEFVLKLIGHFLEIDAALEYWTDSETKGSTDLLVEVVFNYNRISFKNQNDVVFINWLNSPAVKLKLECAFFAETNSLMSGRISIAHAMLDQKLIN